MGDFETLAHLAAPSFGTPEFSSRAGEQLFFTADRLAFVTYIERLNGIVKANDIRGLVPEELDANLARALGGAAADVIVGAAGTNIAGRGAHQDTLGADHDGGSRSIIVGHDMRPSSPELAQAFAEGARRRGADVIMIGLCSTDGLYHASGSLNSAGAMFTASHNPAEYNGIKICAPGALPVGIESGLAEIRDLAGQYAEAGEVPSVETTGTYTERDTLREYAEFLRGLVDLHQGRRLRIVVDAGNGMAGLTVPAVFEAAAGFEPLNVEIIPLYFELDGTFPNHPANPLEPDNLRDLQDAVLNHEADLGLAFDGDADRCFVVDERGEPVNPSAVTILVGLREVALEKNAGREPIIIHNLITSRAVPEIISAAGGTVVRTRVGHSFIKQEMARTGAVFGGEHSAHYYFRDFYGADSGMLAAMHLLAAMKTVDAPLSELVAEYHPYVPSGEINSSVDDIAGATQRVIRHLSATEGVQIDDLDGLMVSHWHESPKWWVSLRASNTEPLLRLNIEAETAQTMQRIRDEVLALVREEPGEETK